MSAFNRSREPDNLHARERAPPRSRSTVVILRFLPLECAKDEEVRSVNDSNSQDAAT